MARPPSRTAPAPAHTAGPIGGLSPAPAPERGGAPLLRGGAGLLPPMPGGTPPAAPSQGAPQAMAGDAGGGSEYRRGGVAKRYARGGPSRSATEPEGGRTPPLAPGLAPALAPRLASTLLPLSPADDVDSGAPSGAGYKHGGPAKRYNKGGVVGDSKPRVPLHPKGK